MRKQYALGLDMVRNRTYHEHSQAKACPAGGEPIMTEGRKDPLTHAGLIAHKLAVEAEADVIGEQCNEDGASLKTVLQLLCYVIAARHVVQQRAVAKLGDFCAFAQPEPAGA